MTKISSLVKNASITSIFAGAMLAVNVGAAKVPEADLQTYQTGTAHEMRIRDLQTRFGRGNAHPVVIVDREWFALNSAVHGAGGETEAARQAQQNLMRQFMRSRAGVDTHPIIAELFYREIGTGVEQAMAHGYPGSRFSMSGDTSGPFCMLYPGNRIIDNEFQTRLIINYRPEVYGSLYQGRVRPILTYEEHVKLTDYHELAHCLDDAYMLDYLEGRIQGDEAFLSNRHRIELKAEILGVLLMVKFEGSTDLAQRRSQERYLDSWFRGRVLAQGGMDIMSMNSGATYSFGRGLEQLQNEIDQRGLEAIRNMSVPELSRFAEQVTESSALNTNERQILVEAYQNPARALAHPVHGGFINDMLNRVASAYLALTGNDEGVKAQVIAKIIAETPTGGADELSFPELAVDQAEKETITARLVEAIAAQAQNSGDPQAAVTSTAILRSRYLQHIESGNADQKLIAMQEIGLLPEALRRYLRAAAKVSIAPASPISMPG